MTDYTYAFDLPLKLPEGELESIQIHTSEGDTELHLFFKNGDHLWIPIRGEISVASGNENRIISFCTHADAVLITDLGWNLKETEEIGWRNIG